MSQTPDATEIPQEVPSELAEGVSVGSSTPEAATPPVLAADVAAELSGLADLPVDQHPDVYDDIHRRLGDTLSGIDHV